MGFYFAHYLGDFFIVRVERCKQEKTKIIPESYKLAKEFFHSILTAPKSFLEQTDKMQKRRMK